MAIYDKIQAGWIRFTGKGNPPIRHMGAVFDGFAMPKRETLNELDETQWELDLSGRPQDPWQHQNLLPLQNTETGELLVFGTTSVTGRRAVGNLIAFCDRLQIKEPNAYPVIKLQVSGFQHRDDRVGWVKVPAFTVVGRAPKDSTSPATTSLADDMDDGIPEYLTP